jgi:hypothetical protein
MLELLCLCLFLFLMLVVVVVVVVQSCLGLLQVRLAVEMRLIHNLQRVIHIRTKRRLRAQSSRVMLSRRR